MSLLYGTKLLEMFKAALTAVCNSSRKEDEVGNEGTNPVLSIVGIQLKTRVSNPRKAISISKDKANKGFVNHELGIVGKC